MISPVFQTRTMNYGERLDNLPHATQALLAARAFCFVSKTPLFPKGAVNWRKRGGPAPLANEAGPLEGSRTRN